MPSDAMQVRPRPSPLRRPPLLYRCVRCFVLFILVGSVLALTAATGFYFGRTDPGSQPDRAVSLPAGPGKTLRSSRPDLDPDLDGSLPVLAPFKARIGRVIASFVLLRLGFPVHSFPDCAFSLKLQAPLFHENKAGKKAVKWDHLALRSLCRYESWAARTASPWPFPSHLFPWSARHASSPLAEVWSSFDPLDWHDFIPRSREELGIKEGKTTRKVNAAREQAKSAVLSAILGYSDGGGGGGGGGGDAASSLRPSQEWLTFCKLVDELLEQLATNGVDGQRSPATSSLTRFSRSVVEVAGRLSQRLLQRLGVPREQAGASAAGLEDFFPSEDFFLSAGASPSLAGKNNDNDKDPASTLASLSSAVPRLLSSQAELNTLRWTVKDHGPLASLSQCDSAGARADPCLLRSTLGLRGCIEDELCGWCPRPSVADPLGQRRLNAAAKNEPGELHGLCLSRSLVRPGGPLRREAVGASSTKEDRLPFCASPQGLLVDALSLPSLFAQHYPQGSARSKAIHRLHPELVEGGEIPLHLELQSTLRPPPSMGTIIPPSFKPGLIKPPRESTKAQNASGFITSVPFASVEKECGLVVTRSRPRLLTLATNGLRTDHAAAQSAAEAQMAFRFMSQTAPRWYDAASEAAAEGTTTTSTSDGLWTLRQHVWLLPLTASAATTSAFSHSWSSLFTSTCPRDLRETFVVLSSGDGERNVSSQAKGICYLSVDTVDSAAIKRARANLGQETTTAHSEILTGLSDPIPIYENGDAFQAQEGELEPLSLMQAVWSGWRLGIKGTAALTAMLKKEAAALLSSASLSDDSLPRFLLSAVKAAAGDLGHFYSYQRPPRLPSLPRPIVGRKYPFAAGAPVVVPGHAAAPTAASGSMALRGLEQYALSHLGLRLWDEGLTRADHARLSDCVNEGELEDDERASAVLSPLANPRPLVSIISRHNKRFIVNEREVAAALLAAGLSGGKDGRSFFDLQLLTLESMPLYSQLLALRRTDVLIGAHGSGLFNAIFMRGIKAATAVFPPGRHGRPASPLLLQLLPLGLASGQGSQFFRGPALGAGVDYQELGGQKGTAVLDGGQSEGGVDALSLPVSTKRRDHHSDDEAKESVFKRAAATKQSPEDFSAVSSRQHWHFATPEQRASEEKRRGLLSKSSDCCGYDLFFSFWINQDLRVDNMTRLVEVVTERLDKMATVD